MANVLGALQKLGKALTLPVAVLPVAGLLLRLGAPDVLDLKFMFDAGNAIFSNLSLIFAISVAIGFAKNDAGAAGLAGGIGYFVLTTAMTTINKDINMGVLAGILMGVSGGLLYNRFHAINFPEFLAFFGGKRFIPIINGALAVALAFVLGYIWPPVQVQIQNAGQWMVASGALGAFSFGTLNRLLIPLGLHHVLNNLAWFVFGDFTNAAGVVVNGDLHRFFAGDTSAGMFMTGFFPVMMFGLPAACFAMYTTAKKENRKKVAGILFSVGFTSFLTGVTEPVEFLFMFLAPVLYVMHAVAMGISLALCSALEIKHGFSFSAGAIDYFLNYGLSTKGWMIFVLGAAWAAVYYFLFVLAIKALNLKTPGREDASDETAVASATHNVSTRARQFLKALGGHANLRHIDACITRLRLAINHRDIIDEGVLKALGAKGVVGLGENHLQVVLGLDAVTVADEMKKIAGDDPLSDIRLPSSGAAPEKAPDGDISIVAPLSGELVPIEEVPDEVFSEKMAGDGIAIMPDDSADKLVAPVDGVIGKIFESNHAFSIQTTDGLELFVHFGLDTIDLKGEGFTRVARNGQMVKKGDVIIKLDMALLRQKAKNTITPVVVANMDAVKQMHKQSGSAKSGQDTVIAITL